MKPDDVLETLDLASWQGPFAPDIRMRAQAALEAGRVVFLPALRFALAPDEQRFLAPDTSGGDRKNVSFDHKTGRIHGTSLAGPDAKTLGAMVDRFGRQAEQLLHALVPGYAGALERARTSFRPTEVEGRAYSPRHDDRLLHVDAFPTRPMRGRRILRLFSNIAPDGSPRRWQVGEPFPEFAARFLPQVRRALPGASALQALLGLTRGRRSRYDEIMIALHDVGKLDGAYQASAPKVDIGFPAGSTWICCTDAVLHAALAGRCALEQTFHLPVAAMAEPDRAPLRVLERLSGRALA